MAARESLSEHWEEADFRAVFLKHYARMVAILAGLLGDRSRAEEVVSDAFWRLYRQPAFDDNRNVGGWLYRTATNLGIDALRASYRRSKYEQAVSGLAQPDSRSGPLDELLRDESRRRVRTVLASIAPSLAQLLILRNSGFSYRELAEALAVKVSGIGTMLNRAEEEFRKRYLALYPDPEEL